MKLLSVIHYPVFAGPHNTNVRIAPLLRDAGIDLTVVLPDEPGNAAERIRAAGVPVVTMPLHRIRGSLQPGPHIRLAAGFPREVAAIRSLLADHDYDVVMLNGLANAQAAVAGRRAKVGVVWQLIDTNHPHAFRRAIMPLVARLADVVMTTGMAVAGAHPGALSLSSRLVNFFPPVDFDEFSADPGRRAAARAELGLDEHALVVGNVGHLSLAKGHRDFIRAAALVRSQRPDVCFVILGAQHAHLADYVRGLIDEATSLGLELGKSLVILDPGFRVAELASAFDVFWLTSPPASEGIPTVIGEAMALELPVVATDSGSVREAVADGVTGSVVQPLEPAAIAEATIPYLDDPELRRRAGLAGRERARELYSLETCAATHVAAVERAAARARSRRTAAP